MGQGEFALPGVMIIQLPLAHPSDAPPKGPSTSSIAPATAVWETTVMPGDRKSSQRLARFQTLESPGRGVVHFGAAM